MIRSLAIAVLGGLLLVLPPWAESAAANRAPLLMEGKKTLYQRVLSRPGAVVKREPGDGPGAQQPALTRFYVYDRKSVGGVSWLEVGLTSRGATEGWVREDAVVPWKQQLTLAFTNPANRDRALLFKDRADLAGLVGLADAAPRVTPLRQAVESGRGDPRVLSIEPATYIDLAKKFYLLPILEAEETMSGSGPWVRLLKVASVSARDGAPAAPPPPAADDLRNFRAAVVFVIDSTVSMDPYIERTRETVRHIADRIEQAGLSDQVRFGLVAFRSNVKAVPGLEYVSKLYVDPAKVRGPKDFLAQVSGLRQATVSSARFSEDSYAGVMTALDQINWEPFGGRYVVLITDAGALRGNDPLSSTKLDAEQVRLEAEHRGVALLAFHLLTPSGLKNHQEARAQYEELSRSPLTNRPLYYPVQSGSVDQFGAYVDQLANSIVTLTKSAARGEPAPGAAATAKPAAAPSTPAAALQEDAALLGQAMRLAYLGHTQGTQAPPLFSAWICDRDLAKRDIPTTEVRVLLTKNQLSDLQQVLQAVLSAGEASQSSPKDFFNNLLSATAKLMRDPAAVKSPTKLADLGLLGEYLDDLPYRSRILSITQQDWSSWGFSAQQEFLDSISRRLRLYQIYHDDVDRWVALDGGADPGEAVYPVPLEALP